VVCIVFVFCAATAIVSPAQTYTMLYGFSGGADGANPGALVQGTDGSFYGTTGSGGSLYVCGQFGCGTVFKITPNGTLTTLHSFVSSDGRSPNGLVQGTDGNFYGTTSEGGAGSQCDLGCGTVYKMTPSGTLTTLHSFNNADGAYPDAGLVQATDGNFYGTTAIGGANSWGTVFKITPAGTLTTLYSFCSQSNCADGSVPWDGLVQATDGNFYGTISGGGANSWGTVFKITPAGTLTTLYSFCSQPRCTDGQYPLAGLLLASDGNFYGTTSEGGIQCDFGCGTVFKITPNGTLTTLHSFVGSEGSSPNQLVQGTDGNFYGTAQRGGPNNCGIRGAQIGCGTIFEISSQPPYTVTILHAFSGADGNAPGTLVQATDGNFYGTTSLGGGDGTVFRLSGIGGIITSPWQFVPVTPCRLYDTRPQYGGDGAIPGGTFQTLNLAQLAQTNHCANLSTAAAYSLNVTVVPPGQLGYLTIWPAGRPQPLVSTLNSYDGRVKANAAIVQAGASAAVSVYVSNTTNVILDIDGYFTTPSQQTLQFYPLPPCRVADTRDPNQPQGLGPPYVSGGVPRDFPVLAAGTCNIPSSAQAYSLNFTVVPHGFFGYLTVWPTGQNLPVVSTLNAYGGQYTANAAIVPAGTDGKVSTYAMNDTDLVIDINGYFAAPGQGGQSLYAMAPCRVLDTRDPYGNGPFRGTLSPPVDLRGFPCAVPSAAQAYVLNATVVPKGEMGYLTLWPDGMTQPIVSTLNALDGIVTSNMAIVPAGNQGQIDAYADVDSSLTDLILDIFSYFAP
jgi:uncharacterized repeat protein (TIGR03803 family)